MVISSVKLLYYNPWIMSSIYLMLDTIHGLCYHVTERRKKYVNKNRSKQPMEKEKQKSPAINNHAGRKRNDPASSHFQQQINDNLYTRPGKKGYEKK